MGGLGLKTPLVLFDEPRSQRLSFKGPNLKDLFIRNLGLGDLDLRDLILRDLVLREPVRLLTSMLRIPRTDKCDEKVLLCSGFQYSECILMFHVEVRFHKKVISIVPKYKIWAECLLTNKC